MQAMVGEGADGNEALPVEIDVDQAAGLLEGAAEVVLLDCREQSEYDLVHLPDSLLVPTSEFLEKAAGLEPLREKRLLVLCHHGVRSLGVTQWLRQHGFSKAQSISGGIDQWARQRDPQMLRY